MRFVLWVGTIIVIFTTVQVCSALPSADVPAQFEPAVLSVGGRKVGIVNLRTGETRRRVAEIWSESPKWSYDQRARAVASRLASVHEAADQWWRNLVVARFGGVAVVAIKGMPSSAAPPLPRNAKLADGSSPEGCVYVITADKKAASEFGLSEVALARHLIAAIQNGMDPQRIGRRSAVEMSPEEQRAAKHAAAIHAKQAGDEAWSDGDLGTAIERYGEAVTLSPNYVAARVALAAALMESGDKDNARKEARRVLSIAGATAEQRASAQRILKETAK